MYYKYNKYRNRNIISACHFGNQLIWMRPPLPLPPPKLILWFWVELGTWGNTAVIPEMFIGDVIRRCFSPTCRGHILVFVFLNSTEGVKRMLSGVGRAHVPLALAQNEEQQTINKFSVGDNVVLTACLWLIFCAMNTARSQGWVRWPPHRCGAGWQGVL